MRLRALWRSDLGLVLTALAFILVGAVLLGTSILAVLHPDLGWISSSGLRGLAGPFGGFLFGPFFIGVALFELGRRVLRGRPPAGRHTRPPDEGERADD